MPRPPIVTAPVDPARARAGDDGVTFAARVDGHLNGAGGGCAAAAGRGEIPQTGDTDLHRAGHRPRRVGAGDDARADTRGGVADRDGALSNEDAGRLRTLSAASPSSATINATGLRPGRADAGDFGRAVRSERDAEGRDAACDNGAGILHVESSGADSADRRCRC